MKKTLLITAIWFGAILQLTAQSGSSGESATFTVDTKKPEVTLNTPNGGGNYSYEEPLQITWSATDNSFGSTPISAGLSTEEGGTVNWLGQNLSNSGTTSVNPPEIVTNFAKAHIKAIDAFGNEAVDESDEYFELFEPCQNATANAGDDAEICENESFQLNGQAENFISVLWETTGTGTFDAVNALQTNYYPGNDDVYFGFIELCLTAFAEDPCEDASACLVLEILPLPFVDAGSDLSICEDQAAVIDQCIAESYSEILWTTSGDGIFSNPSLLSTSYYPGVMDPVNGSVELTLTASAVNPCIGTVSDNLTVFIEELPIIDIGSDYTICEDETVVLSGVNIPGLECGLLLDGYPFYGNTYTPSSGDIQAGSVEFCLVCEAPPPCTGQISDCFTVFINQNPTVNAGEDLTISIGQSASLNAFAENYSAVDWQTNGDGTFDDDGFAETDYFPGAQDFENGSVQLQIFAEPQYPCMLGAMDEVTIFCEAPVVDLGLDETVCKDVEFINLPCYIGMDIPGIPYEMSYGDGEFSGSAPYSCGWSMDYTPGPGDLAMGFVEMCVTFNFPNPPGFSVSDCKTFYFQDLPMVDAGENMTILENETASLNATAQNYSTVLWTTSGDGVFDDANELSTIYTSGANDIQSGNVELCISAQPLSPCVLTVSDCLDLEIISVIETYFEPVWGSPYNPMSVYIVAATLDDLDLQPGDEIGLFDVDPVSGDEVCVGAGTLTEVLINNVYLEIIASMNDDSNPDQINGFVPGNTIIYKYYNTEIGEIKNISANYPYPGYDEVYASQGSAFAELSAYQKITQEISLNSGWNMMSFMIEPDTMDMLHIVQPLIDQDLLVKVLDEDAGTINHLPFPPPNGQWTNTIGTMANTEGYYIKVTESTELTAEGALVSLPIEIELTAGWNIIGYPCEDPADAMNIVQPLIDAGVLYKVIDENGGNIFHLPFPPPNGQWSNTIGNFESGEGYYVKVSEDCSIIINEPEKGSTLVDLPEKAESIHFEPAFQNNPYMPASIVLTGLENLDAGDEIGIFDGDVCVGTALVGESSFVAIPVSMDDPTSETQDGFISGNQILAHVWQQKTNLTIPAELVYLEGVEMFQPLETYIGELLPLLTTTEEFAQGGIAVNVFPNPFSDFTWVYFTLPESGEVEIALFDIAGQKQSIITQAYFSGGNGKIKLNAQAKNPGCYILKFTFTGNSKSGSFNKKLIIR